MCIKYTKNVLFILTPILICLLLTLSLKIPLFTFLNCFNLSSDYLYIARILIGGLIFSTVRYMICSMNSQTVSLSNWTMSFIIGCFLTSISLFIIWLFFGPLSPFEVGSSLAKIFIWEGMFPITFSWLDFNHLCSSGSGSTGRSPFDPNLTYGANEEQARHERLREAAKDLETRAEERVRAENIAHIERLKNEIRVLNNKGNSMAHVIYKARELERFTEECGLISRGDHTLWRVDESLVAYDADKKGYIIINRDSTIYSRMIYETRTTKIINNIEVFRWKDDNQAFEFISANKEYVYPEYKDATVSDLRRALIFMDAYKEIRCNVRYSESFYTFIKSYCDSAHPDKNYIKPLHKIINSENKYIFSDFNNLKTVRGSLCKTIRSIEISTEN